MKQAIDHHKTQRGRFVYVQTPGIFERLNGPFGIENHLMYMIHVSDDWGAQVGLMFSPATWKSIIFPYHKVTCDAVKKAGGYMSLHSDGNVMSVLDGIVELGYDVVHPYQVSAGMDYNAYFETYQDKFSIMGGIDIQTTLGFGRMDQLKEEIEMVIDRFSDRGLLLCNTHFVQNHCSIEALTYDLIYKLIR